MRASKRMAWLGALTVAAGVFALAQTGPAAASTCGTPGCGGVVRNASNHDLDISNCWQSGPVQVTGDWPPCATVFSQNKYNAVWFITKGHTSTQAGKYYYDTDAFQAPAGCVTRGQEEGSTFDYNRKGKAALWIKINSAEKNVVITSISC